MPSELERHIAHNRAQQWTRADTEKVMREIQRFGLLRWAEIGKRWPHKMACDFYCSHAATDVESYAEATRAIKRHARAWDVSEEFVWCLCALGFLAQDTVAQGFAFAVAVANSIVVAEPFRIAFALQLETPFWSPEKEGE